MNFGIELRQRSRSGGSSGDYIRVHTDEHEDDDDDFRYHSLNNTNGSSSSALRNRRGNRSDDDEEDDDSPSIGGYARRVKFVPKPPSNTCKFASIIGIIYILDYFCSIGLKLCVVISIAGIVFLGIISYLLANSSPYIRVSPEYESNKPKLVDSIHGAIFLYVVCLVISCYLWWRSHFRALTATDSRFMD